MSATTHTLLDVVQIAGFRVKNFKQNIESVENPDVATKQMVYCVNEVLRKMASVKGLPIMNTRYVIQTVDDYQASTVTVTKGDATVTGAASVWTSDMVGRAFSLSSNNTVYRIAAIASATSLELDDNWNDDTEAGAGYVIAQDRYDLPADFGDFAGTSSVMLQGPKVRPLDIKAPSEIDFQRHSMRSRPLDLGGPTMVSIYDRASSGVRQIEVDPFPDDLYTIHIRYQATPTKLAHDNSVVPVFDKNIDVLVNGIVARWKSIVPNTPEDAMAWQMWQGGDLAMMASFDREKTDEPTKIVPADVMRGSGSTPYGQSDWGANR
uniref:Uncharacterized protein n=1 Tax=viral metagenome TaxID=1070528 RepID=A0A6H1ZPW4_9ZZZZ